MRGFTGKNQYNDLDLFESPSLLEVAEAAGMHTAWVSCQALSALDCNPLTTISREARQQFWLNRYSSRTGTFKFYDGELLPKLDEVSLAPRTLLVVHLIGSHWSFDSRYPADFAPAAIDPLTGDQYIDTYDTSIAYTDEVMRQLAEKVSAWPNFKALLYFSDHGLDAEQRRQRLHANYVPAMSRIPMYALFSESYMAEHPEVVATLRQHKDAPFTNDLVYNLMLGIMGVRLPGDGCELRNDFTSPDYDATPSRFRTLRGKKGLE